MFRLLLSAALVAVTLAAGAQSAGASLFIGISNGFSPWPLTATSGSVSFAGTGLPPFACTSATLNGTLPTATYVAPLGTPVLPIGSITGGTVSGCPSGFFAIFNTSSTNPWGIALNRVLLNANGAFGIAIAVLVTDIQVITPGDRCIYRGALGALYDESGTLTVSGSLPYWFGSCSGGSLSVTGTFAVAPAATLFP